MERETTIEEARQIGQQWAEREAQVRKTLHPTWLGRLRDCYCFVNSDNKIQLDSLAKEVHNAALKRWSELCKEREK